jgi:hypothetical protein
MASVKTATKATPATKTATKATKETKPVLTLAQEKARATALAKQYDGKAELLTLAEAQAVHPNLVLTAEDMANPAYFHLRFRPCGICGRFPARAIRHYALHESGALNDKGNVTDKTKRKAIEARVAKALKTIAGDKPKAAKVAKPKAA